MMMATCCGQALGLQRGVDGALLGGQLMDAQRAEMNTKESPLYCICGFQGGRFQGDPQCAPTAFTPDRRKALRIA